MILVPIIVSILCFYIGIYCLNAWFISRIFKKAGLDQWKAWVPIYNEWCMLELGDQRGWYVLLAFVPIMGTIAYLTFWTISRYEIGKKLGKDDAFVLLAVFIDIAWLIWLAFDESRWVNSGVNKK
jgi:H+/gluconate symporter-like permease